ncbi:unnamed protein product [Dibothriocephalus latus]|uniref:Uncharacterized protein n=1 Tax=Dibothriocephalus latus TaxID=60516 RepID=A0A3P7L915_DIBLA|nr:unnamed protein product [Dibothriocephalus latus]
MILPVAEQKLTVDPQRESIDELHRRLDIIGGGMLWVMKMFGEFSTRLQTLETILGQKLNRDVQQVAKRPANHIERPTSRPPTDM